MKKNKSITIISILLMVAALIGSLFLDDVLGSRISNIVTIITAIIGAVVGVTFINACMTLLHKTKKACSMQYN